MTTVALFVPCYVDQLFPEVGHATRAVLRRLGVEVVFPFEQTCCGQALVNSGCAAQAVPLAERFVRIFDGHDAIVAPSASCVSMVRKHYRELLGPRPDLERVAARTHELCEYLVDVAKVTRVEGELRAKVGLHHGCHGLRELRLARSSERVEPAFDKVRGLLAQLDGIELVLPERRDECCGFGGTFAVGEPAISCTMGKDRLTDHVRAGASIVTGTDVSCLMHLDGVARKQGIPIRLMHVAEILAGARLS